MNDRAVCVVEFIQGALRVSCVSPRMDLVTHRVLSLSPEQEDLVVKELRSFVQSTSSSRRVITLFSRAVCLMGAFHFPSKDPAEIQSMAEFKFARSTPHRRDDMVVDIKYLDNSSSKHSFVAVAMTTKDTLKPYLNVLEKAGLVPDIMTVNIQRLLPLARVIWGNSLNGEGRVLGLCLDNTLYLGFFARGDLLFSREELITGEMDSVLGAFIEYCHKEFPGTPVREGISIGNGEQTGMSRMVSGVNISVQDLAFWVRSKSEQTAYELSPVAYLDLLLARDKKTEAYDFSPEYLKDSRRLRELRVFAGHVVLIIILFLAGLTLKVSGEWHKRSAGVIALRNAVEREATRIKELEKSSQISSAVESYISAKVSVSGLLLSLSQFMPKGAQLVDVEIKEGVLSIHGIAEDLDSVRAFQTAIQGSNMFKEVHLDGIDKGRVAKTQQVAFRITAQVKK